jgi:hypothetical protein
VFIASGTIVVDTIVSSQVPGHRASRIVHRAAQARTAELTEFGLTLSTLRVEDGGCFSREFSAIALTMPDRWQVFSATYVRRPTGDCRGQCKNAGDGEWRGAFF